MKRKSFILIFFVILFLVVIVLCACKKDVRYSFEKAGHTLANDTIIITPRLIDISKSSTDRVTAQLQNDGTLVISGIGNMKDNDDLEIWEGIDINNVIQVNIAEGVTNIGSLMFAEFQNLRTIKIPSTVSSIGIDFAAYTNVSNIEMVNGNQFFKNVDGVIYNKAGVQLIFYPQNKSGNSFEIPSGVTSIREDAFGTNKNLDTIIVPSTISEIPSYTFAYTNKLSNIEVDGNNSNYNSVNGILFNKNNTKLICYPNKLSETRYEVPGSVITISENAFGSDNNLEELILSEGIRNIEENAFYGCRKLKRLIIPKSVKSLPDQLFSVLSTISKLYVYCGSYAENFIKQNNYSLSTEVIHTYNANGICTACGLVSSEHQHNCENWTIKKEATCLKEGEKTGICSICNAEIKQKIEKTEHTYPRFWTVAKEPTINEKGLRYRICETCGERQEEEITKITDSDLLLSTKYNTKKVNNVTYIILPNTTTVGDMLKSENIYSNKQLKIVKQNNSVQASGSKVGTGYKVLISSTNTEIYTIIVKGDSNGDGKIDFINDIIQINNYRLRKTTVPQEVVLAADVNEDGKVDFINDIIKINNYRLGKISSL